MAALDVRADKIEKPKGAGNRLAPRLRWGRQRVSAKHMRGPVTVYKKNK